jgi:hypothetical protein
MLERHPTDRHHRRDDSLPAIAISSKKRTAPKKSMRRKAMPRIRATSAPDNRSSYQRDKRDLLESSTDMDGCAMIAEPRMMLDNS